jgi:multicomponent Na+:H+ antiporter subunit E
MKKLVQNSQWWQESRIGAKILTFIVCFATWIILSGRFDAFHLMLGVLSSAIVAGISSDLLFPVVQYKNLPKTAFGFITYIPWLLYQVFLANLHVLYLSFHPRMKELIDPQVVTFQSRLKGDMALLIFANSITLTPGTVTIYVSVLRNFTVHAIDGKSAAGLPGEMEAKIEKIFD